MRINYFMGNKSQKERFHKNLFFDNSEDYFSDQELDEDDDRDFMFEDDYQSKFFKLNSLSLPLTDTIAEIVQDLSKDQFFLNDLSFVFEMSRKRAISPYAIIVALLYLKRLKTKISKEKYANNYWSCCSAKSLIDSYFKPKQKEPQCFTNAELCLVSILLASKFLIDEGEDDEIYNDQWADAADIPVKKINQLEKLFLKRIEWELFVSADEFWKFTNELTEKATRKKVKLQLGNCTYSDLEALLSFSNYFSLVSVLKCLRLLLKIFLVCSSTLLYVTLSTYLVSKSVILIKNNLANIEFNVVESNSSSIYINHGFDTNQIYINTILVKSGESVLKNDEIEYKFKIVKSIKTCKNNQQINISNPTTISNPDDTVTTNDARYSFIKKNIFHSTLNLIF